MAKETNRKVLLINPETSRNKYDFGGIIDDEPLELEIMMAELKSHGHDVKIWDGQLKNGSCREALKSFRPEFVYICGRTRQENFIKEYCRLAKHICGSTTIVGGIHAQNNPDRFSESYIDFVDCSFDPARVTAIVEGEWTERRVPAEVYDIRKMPRPDRSFFYEHMSKYCYLELRPIAQVRTAYCCPYRCNFCYRNRLNCGQYTARDIEDVVDEIASIECDNIYIIDDDFLFNTTRLERFIELIKARGIHKKYVCFGRADFIATHEPLLAKLKEIGFYYVLVGLEYVDQKRLKQQHKLISTDTNSKAVEILNRLEINMMGMFITDPDYVGSDFMKLYRWAVQHKLKHVAVSIFTPEMSLETFDKYKDSLISTDPADWDYLHVVFTPEKLSVRAYYFYYHVLLIRFFIRAKFQGIYDFMDYKGMIKTFLLNLFSFGGGENK